MLKIFNDLSVFFEDCYGELGVREYALVRKISPPTASVLLKRLEVEGLLLSRKDRKYTLYRAKRESPFFVDLSRAYWRQELAGIVSFLSNSLNFQRVVLFGSLIKGEATPSSDVDLFVDSLPNEVDLKSFEQKIKRSIQLHFRPSLRNKDLAKNVERGLVVA